MTRTYAAKRLLEHGPLTFKEFEEITGWENRICWRALTRLLEQNIARRKSEPGTHCYLYELTI